MKRVITIAALILVSLSAHAQLRELSDSAKPLGKRISADCGTAFRNGDTIDFFSSTGHEVKVTIDKVAKHAFITRDGETWAASLDAKGNFHLIDPHGNDTVRTPMSRTDAMLRARMTRSSALAMLTPCGIKRAEASIPGVTKCLNNDNFNAPAPKPGDPAANPGTTLPAHTKDCIPDEYGDPDYWGAIFTGELIDQIDWETTQDQLECMRLKSACMQTCNDGFMEFGAGCAALGTANVAAGAACVVGITLATLWCEADCNTTYPNC